MSTTSSPTQNPRANAATLGALWIVYAILRFVAVILLVLYAAAIIVIALSGIFGLFAGLALLAGKSARTLSLLAAFFSVSDLPLGTTLGIYTLIVFLPWTTTLPRMSS